MGFIICLILSFIIIIIGFELADAHRGYNAIGGEVFMLALPLLMIYGKIVEMQNKIDRLTQQRNVLWKHL